MLHLVPVADLLNDLFPFVCPGDHGDGRGVRSFLQGLVQLSKKTPRIGQEGLQYVAEQSGNRRPTVVRTPANATEVAFERIVWMIGDTSRFASVES